jgi:hypothetical protein
MPEASLRRSDSNGELFWLLTLPMATVHPRDKITMRRFRRPSCKQRLFAGAVAAVVAVHLASSPVFCARFQEGAYSQHHAAQPNAAALHHHEHGPHSAAAHAHGAIPGGPAAPAESNPASDHATASSHPLCDFCLGAAFALTYAAPIVSLQRTERVLVWSEPRFAAPFSEVRTQWCRAPPAV